MIILLVIVDILNERFFLYIYRLLLSLRLSLLFSIVMSIKTFNEYTFKVFINKLGFLRRELYRRGRIFFKIFLFLNLFLFRSVGLLRTWLGKLHFLLRPSSTPYCYFFSFLLCCLLNIKLLEIFTSSCPILRYRFVLSRLG